MPTPPPLPTTRAPDWWGRNWKWCVPLLSVAGLLLIAGFIVSVFTVMKSSDAYSEAVARARLAPAVANAIGHPITEGFYLTGNINVNGTSGKAELAIPIRGPQGSATIFVNAHKEVGKWHFDRLVVRVDRSGDRIDLSDK